jgi:glutathione synthase/RimK-type ligase-like ATP-grasp enzyme
MGRKAALKTFERDVKPKIANAINTIKKAMGLAYFGNDCCIDEHFNLIIFEVNANMSVIKLNGDYTDPYTTKINKAITALIEEYPLIA